MYRLETHPQDISICLDNQNLEESELQRTTPSFSI